LVKKPQYYVAETYSMSIYSGLLCTNWL